MKLAYLVQRAHRGAGGGNDVVDEEEQSVFRSQMNSLADQKIELADSEVGRNQVLLLVQVTDPGLGRLLYNHLYRGNQTSCKM